MLVRSKTFKFATLLIACAAMLALPAWAANGRHPDGPAATYRGWGPTDLLADGYQCTLFDSLGVQTGAVAFHDDGTIDLTLGTQQARFQATSAGVKAIYDLNSVADAFPSIPQQYKSKGGYQIMVFAGRFAVGQNLFPVAPVTQLAQSISVVEARCVYIIDGNGNVVFCLNCSFMFS